MNERTNDKRFGLTDDYKGNFLLPIYDSQEGKWDGIMITEVVYILNKLHEYNELRMKIIRRLVDLE